MTDAPTPDQLLNQQLEQLQTLATLLNTEKDVLQHHDPDALIALTQEKNAQLAAISELDKFIGKDMAFAQQKATGRLDEGLAAIKNLLDHCKALNVINGQIIQHSQIAVERMKTSLLESNNKSAITYDGKGKQSAGLSSLNLKA